ncbi:MAG: DUF1614 domain-containing protein [Syntrophobacterales bacterium]|jgi:uncharacterized membrane protein|nr:DUF1614 domain-containing protein [Syntrophobacterales bacterium]
MHYFPITLPFMAFLFFLFLLVLILVEVGVLQYAYQKIGIDRRYVFTILLLSLLGSYVNLPVFQLPPEVVKSDGIISFFGVPYVIPRVTEWPGTVVAVNLGGAVIPTILSVYLMAKNRLFVQSLVGVTVVAAIVHHLSYPVPGMGIAVPTFTPPAVATGIALVLSRQYAPALAYSAGTLGTLIGADLLNLGKLAGLGAPVASIGGAGTFDGIFTTGILAVLLAGLMTANPRRKNQDEGQPSRKPEQA